METEFLVINKSTNNNNFIKKGSIYKEINKKFITLDIETRTIDNIIKPYCFSYFDGNKASSFYLTDFNNIDEMLLACINSLLIRKYKGYKIYVHNLSNFDGIFLIRLLSNLSSINLQPIIKDGKIINLKLSWLSNKQFYNKVNFSI